MDKYSQGFTLDFAYCRHCRFFVDHWRDQTFGLTIDIQKAVETAHEAFVVNPPDWIQTDGEKICKNREIIIVWNRAMLEIVPKT